MTTFPFTVRAIDNTLGFADRTFSIDVTNDQLERFIVVGCNGLATSKDGLTWTPQIGSTLAGILIEWCGDRWVKINGFSPALITWSYDGTSWSSFSTPTNWPSTLITGIDLVYDSASGRTYLWGHSATNLYIGYTTNWTSFTTIYNQAVADTPENGCKFAASLAVFGTNIVTMLIPPPAMNLWPTQTLLALVSNNSGASFTLLDPGIDRGIGDLKVFNSYLYAGIITYPYAPPLSSKSADGTVWASEESTTILGGAGSGYYAQDVLGNVNGAAIFLPVTSGGVANTRIVNPSTYPVSGDYSPGSFATPVYSVSGFSKSGTGSFPIRSAIANDTCVFVIPGASPAVVGSINTIVIGADPFTTATQTSPARAALVTALTGTTTPVGNSITYNNINDIASRP